MPHTREGGHRLEVQGRPYGSPANLLKFSGIFSTKAYLTVARLSSGIFEYNGYLAHIKNGLGLVCDANLIREQQEEKGRSQDTRVNPPPLQMTAEITFCMACRWLLAENNPYSGDGKPIVRKLSW